MSIAPLSRREVVRAVALVDVAIRAGYRAPGTGRGPRSAIVAAGRRAEREKLARPGQGARWIGFRIAKAEAMKVRLPWSENPRAISETPLRRAIAVPGVVRVLAIPDVHLCPSLPDYERMAWIGRFARDEAPDAIVQLGDLHTFDSVTRHAAPGTLAFGELPRIEADFGALEAGLEAFAQGLGPWRGRKSIPLGNHENRLWRFEDSNPQAAGVFTTRLDRTLRAAGWDWKPYGAYHFEAGVGFVHHATNSLGRAYGGKTSAQRIANDATFSIVHGHAHVKQAVDAPKLGASSVRVISPGCALPWGHVEPYAKHNMTGWWWGVALLTIRQGVILDESYVSMLTLERRYAKRPRSL